MARTYGYVETIWGWRKRLPDMQLPWYEFSYKSGVSPDFDPLSDSPEEASTEVPDDIVEALTNKLLNCWSWKRREAIKEEIRSYGIEIKDNTSLIKSAKVLSSVFSECPVENVKRCAELMSACMKHAGHELCVPLDCDVALFYNWYGEEVKIEDL